MDFSLSKQEQLFLQMIREFAEKEVKPLAAEVDESERFPMETVQKMAKLGIMGIPFPVEFGGAGGSNILYTMAVEELSRVCATTGVIVSAHTSLCCAPIMEHGTPEQKAKYLPKLTSGEWIGAFGLTEPNAGTDASAQQTFAVKEGDHYVLNGSKIFITNAGYAHVYIIMAMTDKSKGVKGISMFLVDAGTPGLSTGHEENKMGIRLSNTTDVIFQDAHVSGHACQEEIKLIYTLIHPKYAVPVHGEYKHLKAQAKIAESLGISKDNIFILSSGDVLEVSEEQAKVNGRVPVGAILVDGLGVGDVGNVVLRDRQHLAEDGIMIVVMSLDKASGELVAGPDIVSRGFVYVKESDELIEEARRTVDDALQACLDKGITDWGKLKTTTKDVLGDYVWKKTKRRPMILPIIMEV